jgi:hypothetical protein
MRLRSLEEDPRNPGYGTGTWENGKKQYAPMSLLMKGYQEGVDELRSAEQARMTAQAPKPSGLNADEQRIWGSLDPKTQQILASQRQERPDVQPVAMPPATPAAEGPVPMPQQPTREQPRLSDAMAADAMQLTGEALQSRRYVPGRPGRNPQQEAQLRAPVPLSRVIEAEPGVPYDRQELEDTQKLQREAALMKAQTDVLAAGADQARQRSMAELAQKQLEQQQARQAASEQEYRGQMRQLQMDADTLAFKKPDYKRFTKQMSLGKTLVLAVAAGLQSYARKGGDSSILNTLQEQIRDDIAAQERELALSRGEKQNALRDLSQRWGSLEAGRAALFVTQMTAAEKMAAAQAAELNVPRAQAAAQAYIADIRAAQANERRILEQAAQGRQVVREQQEMALPQQATPGHWVDRYDPKQKLDIVMGMYDRLIGAGKTEAEARKAVSEATGLDMENMATQQGGGTGGPMKPEEIRSGVRDLGAKLSESKLGVQEIDRVMNQLKIQKDPKTGNYLPPPNGIPGVGYGELSNTKLGALAGTQAQANAAALKSINMGMVIDAIGAARDDRQIQDLVQYIANGGSERSIAALLGNLRERARLRDQQIKQGYDKRVVRAYEQNASFDAGGR